MNDAHFDELLALRLKRPLTPDEQAQLESWLATQPSARARWAEEAALSDALHRLPSPPVSSNFQTRVWEEIDAAERGSRTSVWPMWFRWPSLAQQFALIVVVLAAVVFLAGRRGEPPAQVARSLEEVVPLAAGPSVAVLKDFEAIHRLNQAAADLELLAALQTDR